MIQKTLSEWKKISLILIECESWKIHHRINVRTDKNAHCQHIPTANRDEISSTSVKSVAIIREHFYPIVTKYHKWNSQFIRIQISRDTHKNDTFSKRFRSKDYDIGLLEFPKFFKHSKWNLRYKLWRILITDNTIRSLCRFKVEMLRDLILDICVGHLSEKESVRWIVKIFFAD